MWRQPERQHEEVLKERHKDLMRLGAHPHAEDLHQVMEHALIEGFIDALKQTSQLMVLRELTRILKVS